MAIAYKHTPIELMTEMMINRGKTSRPRRHPISEEETVKTCTCEANPDALTYATYGLSLG